MKPKGKLEFIIAGGDSRSDGNNRIIRNTPTTAEITRQNSKEERKQISRLETQLRVESKKKQDILDSNRSLEGLLRIQDTKIQALAEECKLLRGQNEALSKENRQLLLRMDGFTSEKNHLLSDNNFLKEELKRMEIKLSLPFRPATSKTSPGLQNKLQFSRDNNYVDASLLSNDMALMQLNSNTTSAGKSKGEQLLQESASFNNNGGANNNNHVDINNSLNIQLNALQEANKQLTDKIKFLQEDNDNQNYEIRLLSMALSKEDHGSESLSLVEQLVESRKQITLHQNQQTFLQERIGQFEQLIQQYTHTDPREMDRATIEKKNQILLNQIAELQGTINLLKEQLSQQQQQQQYNPLTSDQLNTNEQSQNTYNFEDNLVFRQEPQEKDVESQLQGFQQDNQMQQRSNLSQQSEQIFKPQNSRNNSNTSNIRLRQSDDGCQNFNDLETRMKTTKNKKTNSSILYENGDNYQENVNRTNLNPKNNIKSQNEQATIASKLTLGASISNQAMKTNISSKATDKNQMNTLTSHISSLSGKNTQKTQKTMFKTTQGDNNNASQIAELRGKGVEELIKMLRIERQKNQLLEAMSQEDQVKASEHAVFKEEIQSYIDKNKELKQQIVTLNKQIYELALTGTSTIPISCLTQPTQQSLGNNNKNNNINESSLIYSSNTSPKQTQEVKFLTRKSQSNNLLMNEGSLSPKRAALSPRVGSQKQINKDNNNNSNNASSVSDDQLLAFKQIEKELEQEIAKKEKQIENILISRNAMQKTLGDQLRHTKESNKELKEENAHLLNEVTILKEEAKSLKILVKRAEKKNLLGEDYSS